ncbi:unnamed protein product [Penicillium pancosmium]
MANAVDESTNNSLTPEGPTDSHVLSQVEPDEKGASQLGGDSSEIIDLGWTKPVEHIEERLIAGLSNENLWMLIRRFDKQVYNVKAVPDAQLQNLDLTRADDDEFTPDKLRATIERFYTSVVITLASFVKHVARLRSWKEPRRTAIFCLVYSLAWLLDIILPSLFVALIALVIYPPCRPILFPSAPIALVDKSTGGVQKPQAGVLGSEDSITGAPERFKGEAAEQEASNLVASVASVAVGSAAGKHDQGVPEGAPLEGTVPDVMDVVANTADAQHAASGRVPSESHDKTRQPMRESVMQAANMGMQLINDVTDTFEKLSNSLLKGIPTNAQLTLTLLRIGEANASPLPPPSTSQDKPSSRPISLHHEELELGASREEIEDAASAEPSKKPENTPVHTSQTNTIASSIIRFFKGTTATGVEGKRGFDRVRATIGSRHAKNRVGVLRSKGKLSSPIGPVKFDARYKGKRGTVIIDSTSEPPVLYFTTDPLQDDDLQLKNQKKGSVLFRIPVTDIREMKKLGGLGWKGKLVVGWALGSKEVVDGLQIVGKDPKESFQLTAMGTRNQLFNRLIAIDGQVWACC